MFGKLKSMLKVSEASVVVKQALKALPVPMLPFDVDALSTRLVAISYNTRPDLFDGKQGRRPHPMATAAVSLAGGLKLDEYEFPRMAKQCVFLALGNILIDAGQNAGRYGFSPIDLELLRLSEAAYIEHDKNTEAERSAVLGGLGL